MRVLDSLELQSLRREWDRIYSLRSGIFHGTTVLSDQDIGQLALDALTVCGRVVLLLSLSEMSGLVLANDRQGGPLSGISLQRAIMVPLD